MSRGIAPLTTLDQKLVFKYSKLLRS